MRVLVTGATGYLGSHTVVALLEAGHQVIGVDDFSNSSAAVLPIIEHLGGTAMRFFELDVGHRPSMDRVLGDFEVDGAIHFAGRKYVAESVADPLRYYDRNVGTSAALFSALQSHGIERVVFSSSCTVYGDPVAVPINEACPVVPINPYGRSKALVEEMLQELCSVSSTSAVALRYFNPVGAHPSGLLGEVPIGPPNNLVPYIMQVVAGQRSQLDVFGGDYQTEDGTCIRDYIHVTDLAAAHLKSLDYAERSAGYTAINIGTGIGHSVLDVLAACQKCTGHPIPHNVVGRRDGDAATVFADVGLAAELLDWKARYTLDEMCADHWRFVERNAHRP